MYKFFTNKYDINNFYVGKINFAYKFGNLLIPVENISKEESQKNDLEYATILNGAIDLSKISDQDKTDITNRINYKRLYTLFYKVDDKYYCLHNGRCYQETGDDYCSELVPLITCLPKYSFDIKDKISIYEARKLFKNLFSSKRKCLYNHDKYDIDDFYTGYIDICTSYEISDPNKYDKETFDYDIFRQLTILGNGLYNESGYYTENKVDSKTIEAIYSTFKVIFLKIDQEHLYNINDYTIYRNDEMKESLFASDLEIKKPLRKAFEYNGIDYQEKMSIPEILQLQKRL